MSSDTIGTGTDNTTPDERERDRALMERIRERDYGAIDELYSHYSRNAYALALRVLQDPQTAEEVVQEVFLKVWRQPESFDAQRGRFASWLLSVTRNQSIDMLRKRKVVVSMDEEATQERLNYIADDAPPVDEMIWLRHRRDAVRRAMARLTEPQRKVIELAYFGAMSHSEIAAATGEPLGTIKSRIRQSLLKLKSALEVEGITSHT